MADEIDLSSIPNDEPNGHLNGKSEDSVAPDLENSTTVRAKTKTVLLGGSFAQQIREKLGFNGQEDAEDGFVQVRTASSYASRPARQNYSQSFPSQRNVDAQLESRLATQQLPSYYSATREVRADLPPIVGFLVSYDRHASGEAYELRLGRWIVSRCATMSDNFLVIDDDSISQNHATLRIRSGTDIQLIDQFSEHGTGVLHSGILAEEIITIGSFGHGDIIRFGRRSFHVSIVSKA